MLSDFRFALRRLAQSPGYTLIAIVTLALGLGLNTSMFSLVNQLLLRPLPYPDRDHLVRVYRTSRQEARAGHNAEAFLELQRTLAGQVRIAAFRQWGYTLEIPGRGAESLNALRVSADFFPVLGLQPELGRFFTPEEDRPDNQVVILSHAVWRDRFGGDPAVVGRTILIDGLPTTVVGVLPEKFATLLLWGPGDAFRPLGLTAREKADRGDCKLEILGRFEATQTIEQINARLGAAASALAAVRAHDQGEDGLRAVPLQDSNLPPGSHAASTLVLGLTGIILLIVCANLSSLALARAVSRTHEFAIRAALGSSRRRLLQPLLAESLLLAAGGGVLGLLVAVWGNDWIAKRLSTSLPVQFVVELDWRVIAFSGAAAAGAGLVFGLAPAWLSSRVRVNETLKSGGRGATGDRSQHFVRNGLIVLQFAAVLVQLSCTGYFIRGLKLLTTRDPGWAPAGITQVVVNLPTGRYATPEQTLAYFRQAEERLRALPGVEDVALGWTAPLYQFLASRNFSVEGRPPALPGREPLAFVNGVSPGFLSTLRIRLVAGRDIAASDRADAPRVVLINESMARALFPGEEAVGRRLVTGEGAARTSAEIVGVFADVALAGNPAPPATAFQVFLPFAQEPWNYVTLMVRSAQGPLVTPLRHTLTALDPGVPLQLLNTLEELAKVGTRGLGMITTIFAAFGVLGLLLAALGLYGVISRLVLQRTPEIGVRLALGAQFSDVLRLIMLTGLRLSLLGAALGLVGSALAGLVIAAIFGSEGGIDYATLAITTTLLVAVALFACWVPARRATKIDPLQALRAE